MANQKEQMQESLKVSTSSLKVLPSYFPVLFTKFTWLLFFLSAGNLVMFLSGNYEKTVSKLFLFDGLTAIVWLTVTFFSGIIHSYSLRYMAGYRRLNSFLLECSAFTWVVMCMTASNNIALFILCWLMMGVLMARLIGHVPGWEEAKKSGKNALVYFIISSLCLATGGTILAFETGKIDFLNITSDLSSVSSQITMVAVGFILLAAIIQSGLYPFQGWLLSSMTAPTPASALMHAGFVNAAGILLTRFSSVFYKTDFMWIIVLAGGIGALLGELWKLVQTNYKRKLACSTIGQMGFMILQCGLGFFTAAVAHLILHGFYKAYLFLSSGSEIEYDLPKKEFSGKYKVWQLPIIAVSGVAGAFLFLVLTGKGLELNSGLLLTFVVVVTVMQSTFEIVKKTSLSGFVRILSIPFILIACISAYALFFNLISSVMADMPFVQDPTELTLAHFIIALLYLFSYMAIVKGWFSRSKRLYVYLVNLSQAKDFLLVNLKK